MVRRDVFILFISHTHQKQSTFWMVESKLATSSPAWWLRSIWIALWFGTTPAPATSIWEECRWCVYFGHIRNIESPPEEPRHDEARWRILSCVTMWCLYWHPTVLSAWYHPRRVLQSHIEREVPRGEAGGQHGYRKHIIGRTGFRSRRLMGECYLCATLTHTFTIRQCFVVRGIQAPGIRRSCQWLLGGWKNGVGVWALSDKWVIYGVKGLEMVSSRPMVLGGDRLGFILQNSKLVVGKRGEWGEWMRLLHMARMMLGIVYLMVPVI